MKHGVSTIMSRDQSRLPIVYSRCRRTSSTQGFGNADGESLLSNGPRVVAASHRERQFATVLVGDERADKSHHGSRKLDKYVYSSVYFPVIWIA